jgi:hypothetical protein
MIAICVSLPTTDSNPVNHRPLGHAEARESNELSLMEFLGVRVINHKGDLFHG